MGGTLVIVRASVNTVPAMFVFPQVKYQDHFISDGPQRCIGIANPLG